MKKLFALLFVGMLLWGQSVVPQPGQFTTTVQMLPGAIPTSLTCIVGPGSGCLLQIAAPSPGTTATDPYLCAADFLASGQTITLQDGQPTPVAWIVGGGALTGGWEWHATTDSTCRVFPQGLYIVAGSSGVTGKLTIKYNK